MKDDMKRIAFIGTGLMGAPMARCLLKAGFPVTVWNRAVEKAEALVADGAVHAPNVRAAVDGADVVFTMLSDAEAVSDILFEKGVAEAMKEGAILADTSSIAPTSAREHADRLKAMNIEHIDAPVSGGVAGATAGTLAIMAGGDAAVIERARAVFAPIGRLTHVGPSGAGQICKLANQQIVGVTIGAVAEAMMLVEAGGASREKFRQAIRGGFAESRILELHGARMVERDFKPGGPAKFQLKDLNTAIASARAFGLELPLTEQVRREFDALVADGYGDVDHSGLLLYLEKLNGRTAAE
jgi:2-hydroxy-3-oxopropionate reductase